MLTRMLSERTRSLVRRYWAQRLGCAPERLFASPWHIVTHSAELADYPGIFALFRGGGATVSLPPERADRLRALLPDTSVSPAGLCCAFSAYSSAVIGPAYIGYADSPMTPSHHHPARSLAHSDSAALSELRAACDSTEWERGGSASDAEHASGVFIRDRLVAMASYEVWGGVIAHISVISHPALRGQGFGRSAVAHVASRAHCAGLIPQYRTLDSNLASIRVADALGFCRFATSVSLRLDHNT